MACSKSYPKEFGEFDKFTYEYFQKFVQEPKERDLDGCEIFAGVRSIARGFQKFGMNMQAYDILYDSSHDITSDLGLQKILEGVFRVKRGGLVWLAPVCSTWVWIARHGTGRTKDGLKTLFPTPRPANIQGFLYIYICICMYINRVMARHNIWDLHARECHI